MLWPQPPGAPYVVRRPRPLRRSRRPQNLLLSRSPPCPPPVGLDALLVHPRLVVLGVAVVRCTCGVAQEGGGHGVALHGLLWQQARAAQGRADARHFPPVQSGTDAQCEHLTQGFFLLQTSAQRVSAALACVSKNEKVESGHESAEERESPNAVGKVNAVPNGQVKHVGND